MFTALPPARLPPTAQRLQAEVRAFLRSELQLSGAGSWNRRVPEFSRKVGQRGWIGMTWPTEYGGHERTMLERFVVTEELLAHGAPVGRTGWLIAKRDHCCCATEPNRSAGDSCR